MPPAGSTKTNNTIELYIPVSNPYVQANPCAALADQFSLWGKRARRCRGGLLQADVRWGNRVETYDYDVWQGLAGLKGDIPAPG